MRKIQLLFSILIFVLTLTHGIIHAEEKIFIKPPDFVPATNSNGTIKYTDVPAIEKLFRSYSPILKSIVYNFNVEKFIVPDKSWLHTIIDLNKSFLQRTHIQPQGDAWDC